MKHIKTIVALTAALLLGVYTWLAHNGKPVPDQVAPVTPPTYTVAEAFRNQQSNVQVEGQGMVSRILPDDREGSRHQRFVVHLAHGLSVMVLHNIDVAPRINALREGDTVAFYGEYKWNSNGGVVHWTHHDPGGRHTAGWLRHHGRTYQ